MLKSAIETFKSFFSTSFWFASFLPVAIFAAVHLAIAALVLDRGKRLWRELKPADVDAGYVAVAFAALVVIGYVLAPAAPVLRRILEGELLPEWLNEQLRRVRFAETKPVRDKMTAATTLFKAVEAIKSSRRLSDAREAGRKTGAVADIAGIDGVAQSVRTLREKFNRGEAPRADELSGAYAQLEITLKRNDADFVGAAPSSEAALLLKQAHFEMADLLKIAAEEAQYRLQNLRLRYQAVAYDRPQPTRMADARTRIESYSARVYNVDFDYIWPRLSLVRKSQDDAEGKKYDALNRARDQVDFAMLSLALSLTIPVVWLPVFFYVGELFPFVAVGVAGPLLSKMLYEVAIQSQFVFGEIVKVAIDENRLAVFERLGVEMPKDRFAERALWARLRNADQAPGSLKSNLVYAAPKDRSAAE